jgi:SAF domain-containing protein
VIEESDLTVAHITDDPALTPVPETDLDEVVGMYAANDLTAGSLLAPDAVTSELFPDQGQSIVGVAVTPAQLPATELRPGDVVRIVGTPRDQDNPPSSAPDEITATVAGSTTIPDQGQIVVDVTVDESDAGLLAAQVATGRVAIVLDGST